MEISELLDGVECQVSLVAASILEFVEDASLAPGGSTKLKEVQVEFGSLIKLISKNSVNSGRAVAESLSEMEDFLKLMLVLMTQLIAKLVTSELAELPLGVLQQCHQCIITWTDQSRLFSRKLLECCGGLVHQLAMELKVFLTMWVPTDDFVLLSKNVLTILCNMALEQSCRQALICNSIPDVVVPFCFHSNNRIRWETKSFLALLHQLCYYPFLRLSPDEVELLRLCFESAANSDDHNVILKMKDSTVGYSALELAVGMNGLAEHEANRTVFADSKMFAAIFNLLVTGSMEEKLVSIQLMSKLMEAPETGSVVLRNHPALIEILLSLAENDEVDSFKQDVSMLLQKLSSGNVVSIEEEDALGISSTVADDAALQRKRELNRLLAWATREISKSKVLHNAADVDSTEVVLAFVFLISHLRVMSHFEGSGLSVRAALQDCPDFLSVLQDYTQRHFFKAIKKTSTFGPLCPISLALHCMLILSGCNPQFRHDLGSNGTMSQLVSNLRSMQVIPGWDKQHFRVAELMLLIIANCSLEWSCQQLLAEDSVTKIILPFCKSDYFVIRLGAKCCLSSTTASLTRHQQRLLQLEKHERIALFDALKEFSESGSYRKLFRTSFCNYYFSALDLLLLLSALVENSMNHELLQSNDICFILSQFLVNINGTDLEKDSVFECLWKLCRTQSMQLHVLSALPPHILKCLPNEVFNNGKPSRFSIGTSSQLQDATVSAYKPHEVEHELSELEDLLYETMNEIWRSRVPAAIEEGSYLLDPLKVMNMFAHLANFFGGTNEALHEEGCLLIIRTPAFLPLVANVMIKQIEAKASKLECKQDISSLLVVFHCLQMWINCCEQMKDHLGRSGIISNTVLIHLQLIQRFPAWDEEYFQIAEAVLSTISQCMTRESCHNFILNLDCEDLLVSMAKSELFQVKHNAKMILSSLSRYLPPRYQVSFKLTVEELTDILHSLDMVLERGTSEEGLFFSALEMLQSLKCFLQFEPNRELMAHSNVYKYIAILLQNGDAAEQNVACELLWKLVTKPMSEDTVVITNRRNREENVKDLNPHEIMSEPGVRSFILQNYPEIFAILLTISTRTNSQNVLFSSALLVLMEESEDVIGKDVLKTLMLSEGCYMCSKYAECFKLVSWLYQVSDDEEVKKRALDLKGKALYYVFTFEKRSLNTNVSRANFTLCYNKAREAINLLGLTIDTGVDKVAEKLLDQVHFDYIRTTRSPDLVRCLLCRKKRKLRASHIWPNSVLKHLIKCISSSQQQVFSASWRDYGSLQTAKQLTFPMLCDDCEQLLSRSCESKFKVEFFSKLYDPEDCYTKLARAQSIQYGDFLYRFCVSIIFRALPLVDSDISRKGNADDIYKLFATCRELLLKKDLSDSLNKPSIALLISPTCLPEGVPGVPMIERILHSAGMLVLSPFDLYDSTTCHGKSCFLLAGIGILNLIVSLDPQAPLLLPSASMIDPKGGTFSFPEDPKRFFAMPLGMWKTMESLALDYSGQVFHLPQKLVSSQDWAKHEHRDLQSMLLGFKPGKDTSEAILYYLPDNFDTLNVLELRRSHLKLPAGHRILLHMYEQTQLEHAFLFVAVGADSADSQFSASNPYTVLVLRLPGYIVCMGYFVSHSEAVTTSCLVSLKDKSILPTIEAKFKTRTVADTMLPKLLNLRGFSSIHALLFWMEKVETPLFDMKCAEACWYCSGKCDNCMENASFDRGPILGHHVWETIRFCSEECLRHYRFHADSSDTEILFHPLTISRKPFLTVFCGLLDTELERSRVVAHLYRDSDSQDEDVYVLLQIRYVPKQKFLAFVLSHDFSPATNLLSTVSLTDEDKLVTAGFQLVMKKFLAKFNLPDFPSFLSSIRSSTPGELVKMPPLYTSLDCLPNGFKILEKEQSITFPDPYCIVLHRTHKTYTTCLLANPTAEDGQYLAIFYNSSVDCKITALYAVEGSPAAVAVKKLESKPFSNSYDELVVECCRNIACIELISMLQEREVDCLGAFIAGYRSGNPTSSMECPTTCWLCHPKQVSV